MLNFRFTAFVNNLYLEMCGHKTNNIGQQINK